MTHIMYNVNGVFKSEVGNESVPERSGSKPRESLGSCERALSETRLRWNRRGRHYEKGGINSRRVFWPFWLGGWFGFRSGKSRGGEEGRSPGGPGSLKKKNEAC